ncbi:MAG: branched-chain amino acid ABC transporter permease [Microthrixaceae bacterium]
MSDTTLVTHDRGGELPERAAATARKVGGALRSQAPAARASKAVAVGIAYCIGIAAFFSPDLGSLASGVAAGALYGLIAVGLILIYRTNRIINFAVAAVGAFPAVLAALLIAVRGWNWWVVMPLALLGGPLIGAAVEVTIIRRFATAPRLIVTVATIGISQILAYITLLTPGWVGTEDGIAIQRVPSPVSGFKVTDKFGVTVFTGDYVLAIAVVAAMALALGLFFRFTRMGIALRASAENADRASLLGIPVKRVGTVAWALAGLFGSVTIFLRASIVGIPVDGSLGYQVLLFALAPAVVARMESIPIAVVTGMGVGVLEFAVLSRYGTNDLAAAIMLAFILVSLLAQRGSLSRAQDTGVSTWQALKEYRPVPSELVGVREVRIFRGVLAALAVALLLGAPFLISSPEIPKLSLLPPFAIVAVSLVILTGWAGQISLGQFAIVGVGAMTAGKLYADFNFDFWATFLLGALAGAIVAVVIGLPALRVQGLFLAVSTFALAGAAEKFFFVRKYSFGQAVLPSQDALFEFRRPVLWERYDLEPERNFYYFSVAILALVIAAAWSFRRHHSGRILISTRDNVRGAQAYGINMIRTRLAAFAVSGAIAGIAGVLLVYHQRNFDASPYGVGPSVAVFVATVMGGLTSLPGAVGGALLIHGVNLFGDQRIDNISLLVTGPGLLLILLFLPGGFAQGAYQIRDSFLRWVSERRGILVPSLFADRRVETGEDQADVISKAEERVEAGAFDVLSEPVITCPVCDVSLPLSAAADHPHLRPSADRAPEVAPA